MFHTYAANVLSRCCVCLQWFKSIFRCFCKCFQHMLQVFQLFQMFVESVPSRCCKYRSGVPRVAMGTCHSRLQQLLGLCQAGIDVWVGEAEGA
jgi:hypothetical protein